MERECAWHIYFFHKLHCNINIIKKRTIIPCHLSCNPVQLLQLFILFIFHIQDIRKGKSLRYVQTRSRCDLKKNNVHDISSFVPIKIGLSGFNSRNPLWRKHTLQSWNPQQQKMCMFDPHIQKVIVKLWNPLCHNFPNVICTARRETHNESYTYN